MSHTILVAASSALLILTLHGFSKIRHLQRLVCRVSRAGELCAKQYNKGWTPEEWLQVEFLHERGILKAARVPAEDGLARLDYALDRDGIKRCAL